MNNVVTTFCSAPLRGQTFVPKKLPHPFSSGIPLWLGSLSPFFMRHGWFVAEIKLLWKGVLHCAWVLLCWGPTSMATIQVAKNIGRVSYRQVGLRNLKCCSEIIWYIFHLQLRHRTSECHDPENPRVFLLLVRDVHVVHRPTDLQSGMSQMLKIS